MTVAATDEIARQHRARQAAQAADDGRDEGDQHEVGAHVDVDRAGLRDEDEADGRGQHAAHREGQHDDAVGPHAQHAGHGEVLRRRAHFEAEARALEEGRQRDQDHDRHHDGDDLQRRNARAEDLDLAG